MSDQREDLPVANPADYPPVNFTYNEIINWLRAHRLPEREPGDVTLQEAAEALGLGEKQARSQMRKFVKAGDFTERTVRCPTGQPMTVWRKV